MDEKELVLAPDPYLVELRRIAAALEKLAKCVHLIDDETGEFIVLINQAQD